MLEKLKKKELDQSKALNVYKERNKIINATEKIRKEINFVVYFWENKLNSMGQNNKTVTAKHEKKYSELRELKHIYTNTILVNRLKLEELQQMLSQLKYN